jgi:hypothetical protein
VLSVFELFAPGLLIAVEAARSRNQLDLDRFARARDAQGFVDLAQRVLRPEVMVETDLAGRDQPDRLAKRR